MEMKIFKFPCSFSSPWLKTLKTQSKTNQTQLKHKTKAVIKQSN